MIYLDTSVVVSVCSADVHSARAIALVRSAKDALVITTLSEVETTNAIELRVFRNEISRAEAQHARGNLEDDLKAGVYRLQPFPEPAYARACKLARQLTAQIGIRSADLLHVAAALELGASRLYSFDVRQRQATKAVGLRMNAMP